MKNVLIILTILCFPVFLSLSGVDGDKFIGEWKVINKNNEIKSMVIEKRGEVYSLTYHTGEGGRDWHNETYKYKDGSLNTVDGFVRVKFIESSDHLKWNGDEWERSVKMK